MLVPVDFKIFTPTKAWSKAWKDSGYARDFPSDEAYTNSADMAVVPGVYYTDLNPDNRFKQDGIHVLEPWKIMNQWHELPRDQRPDHDVFMTKYFGAYFEHFGVCDNHEQILALHPFLRTNEKKYFITMTPIHKKNEPPLEGWRWEKWGEYIGTQNSQADYLYDEPEIDLIFCYHIYCINEEVGVK